MVDEYHYDGSFSWPDRRRVAVTLTFDFQGGEDVRPLANGTINHEQYTQAEYGPNTAVWRILRILEDEDVKATFLTCGGIAERYPDAVAAIVAGGHEVAGHGYHHEVARNLTRDEENEVMRKTAAIIRTTAGAAPAGWRSCTQSPNSVALLMEHGYLWNSNSFSHDLPFLWRDRRPRTGRAAAPAVRRRPRLWSRRFGQSGRRAGDLDRHVRRASRRKRPRANLLPVPVPPLYLGAAGAGAQPAGDHPPHEAGRGRVVRDRQRGGAMVPRRAVQARPRKTRLARSRPRVIGTRTKPKIPLPLAGHGNSIWRPCPVMVRDGR